MLAEVVDVSATAATGTVDFSWRPARSCTTRRIPPGTHHQLGLVDGGTSMNTAMALRDRTTVFMVTQGATPFYPTALRSMAGVTPKWQGGTAPSSGDPRASTRTPARS